MVADGKVFVSTYGDEEDKRVYPPNPESHPTVLPKNYQVVVYGLLTAPAPTHHPVINQNRDDVTVLRAATEALTIQTSQCQPIDPASVDCTNAIAQAAGAPAFHRIVMAVNQPVAGCALVKVTTVSKNTGLADASGIGFWSAMAADGNQAPENSGRFIAPAQLKSVGTATLKNGAAATLHEFVGISNCPIGANGSMSRLFKPYMQFENAPNGDIHRNWDVAENYRISRTILQFDRSNDVLER
jgi:hypothetical protein